MKELSKYRAGSGAIDWPLLVRNKGQAREGDIATLTHYADMGRSTIDVVLWFGILKSRGIIFDFQALANSEFELLAGHRQWVQAENSRRRQKGRNETGRKGGRPPKYNEQDIRRIYNEVARGSVTLEELPHVYMAVSTLHRRATQMGLPWPPERKG